MIVKVNENNIQILSAENNILNENEYNIHEVNFEFSEEYSNDLVKVALFTGKDNKTYKEIIASDKCSFPPEILAQKGYFILGVYAYSVENNELVLRYSPSPIKLFIQSGSYIKDEDVENSEPITPSEMEQYQQALQEGLTEVNNKLAEIDNLDIDAEKNGNKTIVTITKKDATTEEVEILDGKDGKDR